MRRLLLRAAQLLLVAAIAWGVWRSVAPGLAGVGAVDFLRWRPEPVRLFVSTALLLGLYLAHALLWRRIMADLGLLAPPAGLTIRLYFIASLGRYLPGKLWQLAGIAVLARNAGLAGGGAAAAALLGQFAFLVTGLLLLALLLPEWAGGLPAILGAALLAAGAAGLWILVATPLGQGGRKWILTRSPEAITGRLQVAFQLADRIRPRSALLWLVSYGMTWILLGLAFTVFTSAFVPAALGDARAVSGSLAASYLAGFIALVPAGLAVREAALVALLGSVPSIPVPAAVVIALSSRIWFTLAELLPLLIAPFVSKGIAEGHTHGVVP